jgi:hydroxymethylpyrimidine pyrophosphatase-like HAD family hydrolase
MYAYTPDDLRITPFDEIPESWVMIVLIGSKEQVDAAQQIAEKLGFRGVRSLPYTYDLPADGVNKGNASRELLDLCGRKLLVCVGDAPNDIDMLKCADIAFVPESASEAMRSLGFRKAAHSDEGTLADVIRQLNQMALGYRMYFEIRII